MNAHLQLVTVLAPAGGETWAGRQKERWLTTDVDTVFLPIAGRGDWLPFVLHLDVWLAVHPGGGLGTKMRWPPKPPDPPSRVDGDAEVDVPDCGYSRNFGHLQLKGAATTSDKRRNLP